MSPEPLSPKSTPEAFGEKDLSAVGKSATSQGGNSNDLFRKEALDYYSRGNKAVGSFLQMSRTLERWFYPIWILLGIGLGSLYYWLRFVVFK